MPYNVAMIQSVMERHQTAFCTSERSIRRASLITQRAASGEKIFRQSKQKTARIVDPMRRFFVTNDGKDSVDSLCGEFLEMPRNLHNQGIGRCA